jgi:oxidase EvaA
VLDAPAGRIRYDTVQSEEGGRFFNAQNRYQVIEVPADFNVDVPADYGWITLHQAMDLLQHSNYLNVQARTLLTGLVTTW